MAPRRVWRTSGGELLASTCSPGSEDVAAAPGPHAGAKAVLPGAVTLLGLVRLLGHWDRAPLGERSGVCSRPAHPCGRECGLYATRRRDQRSADAPQGQRIMAAPSRRSMTPAQRPHGRQHSDARTRTILPGGMPGRRCRVSKGGANVCRPGALRSAWGAQAGDAAARTRGVRPALRGEVERAHPSVGTSFLGDARTVRSTGHVAIDGRETGLASRPR